MLGRGELTCLQLSRFSGKPQFLFLVSVSLRGRRSKGKGKGIRAPHTLSRAPKFPLPLPFQRRPRRLRFSHNRSYVADEVLHTPCPPGITATFSTTLGFYLSGVNLCVQNFAANFSLQIVRQTKFYSRAKKRKH